MGAYRIPGQAEGARELVGQPNLSVCLRFARGRHSIQDIPITEDILMVQGILIVLRKRRTAGSSEASHNERTFCSPAARFRIPAGHRSMADVLEPGGRPVPSGSDVLAVEIRSDRRRARGLSPQLREN